MTLLADIPTRLDIAADNRKKYVIASHLAWCSYLTCEIADIDSYARVIRTLAMMYNQPQQGDLS